MIMVQLSTLDWVSLDAIEQVGWPQDEYIKNPVVYLRSGKMVSATLFHNGKASPSAQVEALVKHLAELQFIPVEDPLADLLQSVPPEPRERVVVDRSPVDAPLIDHGIMAHLDEPLRRKNCRYCNPPG